jgi:hypothetical protein
MTSVKERQSIGCLMSDFALPLLDGGSLSPRSSLVGRKALGSHGPQERP